MEKFINNLYSNSNFPIILGALIIIFVVLFIITLILALKDAKNNILPYYNPLRSDKSYDFGLFDDSNGTSKVDVIEETTQTIPVLKDDEISNFEEFFLENLKDKKDGNIFDFSKKEDKVTEENKKTTSVALEDDTNAINSEPTKEVVPSDMELPKMKQEYTFKELDGESYRLNK